MNLKNKGFILRYLPILFLFCVTVRGDDSPVIVPPASAEKWAELKADVGAIDIKLPEGKSATWELIDDENARLKVCDKGTVATLIALQAGRYKILADSEGKRYRIIVVVGTPAPPIPPVPPAPVDPLIGKLQAAYDLDAGTAKAAELAALTALYRAAVDLFAQSTFSPATVSELVAELRRVATALGVKGLDSLRKIIADELKIVFPTDGPLDKTKAQAILTRIRDALGKVK